MRHSQKEEGACPSLGLCQKKAARNEPQEFISLFLTNKEANIHARPLIIKSLIENQIAQSELASHLGVSAGQITRGSHALKIFSNKFIECLKGFVCKKVQRGATIKLTSCPLSLVPSSLAVSPCPQWVRWWR